MSTALPEGSEWYQLSGHVLLRYGSAHLVDLVTAAFQIRADLAASRVLTSEAEARDYLGGSIRFRAGHLYLAGADGIYVISGNRAITYISANKRFRGRTVRGGPQWSRSGRLHTAVGATRRKTRTPV